jgi:hypothetical protein
MKMGRRLRCSSVTYRFRYAPSSRLAGGHFDRNERHVISGTGHYYHFFRSQRNFGSYLSANIINNPQFKGISGAP